MNIDNYNQYEQITRNYYDKYGNLVGVSYNNPNVNINYENQRSEKYKSIECDLEKSNNEFQDNEQADHQCKNNNEEITQLTYINPNHINPQLTRSGVEQKYIDRLYYSANSKLHPEWYELFNQHHVLSNLEEIAVSLYSNYRHWGRQDYKNKTGLDFFPYENEMFAPYSIPVSNIKMIIIGQDPYPGIYWSKYSSKYMPIAHGYAFSTREDCSVPPSLLNIFKELKQEGLIESANRSPNLEGWINQGVMLLNASLTAAPGEAGRHRKLWSSIIGETLKFIDGKLPGTPVLMFGKDAGYYTKFLNNSLTVITKHPSPLVFNKDGYLALDSNTKNKSIIDKFSGRVFIGINEYLEKMGTNPIDWSK